MSAPQVAPCKHANVQLADGFSYTLLLLPLAAVTGPAIKVLLLG